jgi:hypothetical protein
MTYGEPVIGIVQEMHPDNMGRISEEYEQTANSMRCGGLAAAALALMCRQARLK